MAGRPPGAPNKNKSFLLNRLQEMYGDDFHPIIKIAENCVELQGAVDCIKIPEEDEDGFIDEDVLQEAHMKKVSAIRIANNEWSRIAEYTEPKLKAVEITGANGDPIEIDHLWEIKVVG